MSTENYEEQLNEFKELQLQSKTVSDNALRLNYQIETAQENNKKLIEAADKKFNTHDIDELLKMKESWIADNTNRLAQWKHKILTKAEEVAEKQRLIKHIQQS